jgi:glucose/arabinose dehydrogenase
MKQIPMHSPARNPRRTLCIALASLPAFLAQGAAAQTAKTELHTVRASIVVTGLDQPWGMAWLPDGGLLVTEKRGTLRMVRGGRLLPEPVTGLTKVTVHGQGGLLDVAVHPDHAKNRWIYWSYNGEQDGQHGTEVARGKLAADGARLTDVQVIFRMRPKSGGGQHFGSRLVFGRDGTLYITLGDRGDSASKGREQRAQRLDDHAGSVIRLHDDGRVPADNPYARRTGVLPEIYNHGHRNIQGAALHPATGRLWTHEHGPQGGDEVNIEAPGANYGWPVSTHGRNYGFGTRIGEGSSATGMVDPLHVWVPSIAPSGMAFYTGTRFAQWQGNLFVGALAGQTLVRLVLEGERVVREERLFTGTFGRIRDVRQGPDGLLYLLTDATDGQLIRLEPAD